MKKVRIKENEREYKRYRWIFGINAEMVCIALKNEMKYIMVSTQKE